LDSTFKLKIKFYTLKSHLQTYFSLIIIGVVLHHTRRFKHTHTHTSTFLPPPCSNTLLSFWMYTDGGFFTSNRSWRQKQKGI